MGLEPEESMEAAHDGSDFPSGDLEDEVAMHLEPIQALDTGDGPAVESALLRELMTRSADLAERFADAEEAHGDDTSLVRVNAYKQRLQALRCECADARLRALDAEEKLNAAHMHIGELERIVLVLKTELQQLRSSRAFRFAERLSDVKQAVARLIPRRGS
jgi:hypothetical protein